MAIVKTEAGDEFVLRPPAGMNFFLVHGNDAGLIHERAARLAGALAKGDPKGLGLVRLDGDALSREPSLLRDEANTLDMFGGHRVIWIDGGQRDLSAAFAPMFLSPARDCSVILEAGALKKGTGLRVMFEQSRAAASVECYPDQRRTLEALVDAEVKQAHLRITTEARSYLISLLGSDRLTSRSEVSKLMVYCDGLQQVDVGEVEAIVSDAAPSSAEVLIDVALSGDVAGVEGLTSRYFSEDGDATLIVSRLIARLDVLHQIKLTLQADKSFDGSPPPSLFRLTPSQRILLSEQATKWSSGALQRLLLWAHDLLAQVRKRPGMAELVSTRALWALASSLRKQVR